MTPDIITAWRGLRSIVMKGNTTFAQIKDLAAEAGLPVQKLAHLQQKSLPERGASKAELLDAIDSLIAEEGKPDEVVDRLITFIVRMQPRLETEIAESLGDFGWQLHDAEENCEPRKLHVSKIGERASVFEEPTGWDEVDRQVQEMRERFDGADSPQDYQAIGLRCREFLSSVAREVYDPGRHPSQDGTAPSAADARRMLNSFLEVELKGSGNDEARRFATAAVNLANTLLHKRTADFRTAALCAEATLCTVNILAVLCGRRDRSS